MCRACRKIKSMKGADQSIVQPVLKLLSKFHEKNQQVPGNILVWRFERSRSLRRLLLTIHSWIPAPVITSIIEELDDEVEKIRKKLAGHTYHQDTGALKNLSSEISVNSSASMKAYQRYHQVNSFNKVNCLKIKNGAKHGVNDSTGGGLVSDSTISQTTEIVEGWFARSEGIVADQVTIGEIPEFGR